MVGKKCDSAREMRIKDFVLRLSRPILLNIFSQFCKNSGSRVTNSDISTLAPFFTN